MTSAMFDALRQGRLQALMALGLENWRDVYRAYRAGTLPPPLVLRAGAVLHHEPGDSPVFLFLEICANGCYRKRLRAPRNGAVVDIGANIGLFSIDCALRHRDVRIHAYEPNPATFLTLVRNIADNGLGDRVEAFNEAVGGTSGRARLWVSDGSIRASVHPTPGEPAVRAVDVPQVDLSEAIARAKGSIDVLKIDAEGAEADILEAAPRSVLSRVEQVVGEYHEDLVPGVLDRTRLALEAGGFDVDVRQGTRCGPMFYARRSTAG